MPMEAWGEKPTQRRNRRTSGGEILHPVLLERWLRGGAFFFSTRKPKGKKKRPTRENLSQRLNKQGEWVPARRLIAGSGKKERKGWNLHGGRCEKKKKEDELSGGTGPSWQPEKQPGGSKKRQTERGRTGREEDQFEKGGEKKPRIFRSLYQTRKSGGGG